MGESEKFMFDMCIANLQIRVKNRYPFVEHQCREWLTENAVGKPDILVEVAEDEIREEQIAGEKMFSPGYCESICVYRGIARELYHFDGFVFHASAISMDGEGYIFTAKSGVGKSTHTRYWIERFGERACVINGDKPVIRRLNGRFYVFGTPWMGKESWGMNAVVPLKACCFLQRGSKNCIRPLDRRQVVRRLFHQLLIPGEEAAMNRFLDLMASLIQEIPFYLLECTMEKEAAQIAYDGMQPTGKNKERKEEQDED